MSLENFIPPIEKKFTPNKDGSIRDQLQIFNPDTNIFFNAIKYLTDPEDIKKYFNESIELIKAENPEDEFPVETFRSNHEYISRYGDELEKGWKQFRKTLSKEFHDVINEAGKFEEKE